MIRISLALRVLWGGSGFDLQFKDSGRPESLRQSSRRDQGGDAAQCSLEYWLRST